jgi:hypothetical protein
MLGRCSGHRGPSKGNRFWNTHVGILRFDNHVSVYGRRYTVNGLEKSRFPGTWEMTSVKPLDQPLHATGV